jgi:hypothetical protein
MKKYETSFSAFCEGGSNTGVNEFGIGSRRVAGIKFHFFLFSLGERDPKRKMAPMGMRYVYMWCR